MSGGKLRVRKWDEWQTYRRDRPPPPWIKVYRRLLQDPNFVTLTDAQRGQLVSLWILAADRDGWIPADRTVLKKLCMLDEPPALEVLAAHGFIEGDVTTPTINRKSDVPEAEAEAEEKQETSSLVEVSDLWAVWIDELGGDPPHPRLTAQRSEKLKCLAREHLAGENPLGRFRAMLHAVKASDHHMGTRSYQFPESLFRNEERRDRWAQAGIHPNGRPDHVGTFGQSGRFVR